jgi:hypothetical protein
MQTLSSRDVPALGRLQQRALIVGVVALLAGAVGAVMNVDQFFRSWLIGFLFCLSLSLGSLSLLMLQHISGGQWGMVARRIFEAGSRLLPVVAILAVPVIIGMPRIFAWAQPGAEANPIIQEKRFYLNVGFFIARTVIYFVFWMALVWSLNKWSAEQDAGRALSKVDSIRFRTVSAPGLLFLVITVTFASVDWVMSLEPEWFSTIFGLLTVAGSGLTGLAFTIIVLAAIDKDHPQGTLLTPRHFHDFGKLLLAFVMLWAYLSFSQFLIIWSANLPEEIPWYLRRWGGGWQWVGLLLIFGHFVLPFVLLLSSDIKRSGRTLIGVAVTIILMRIVDLFWNIGPLHDEESFGATWLDAVAPVALGGIWLAIFLWQLQTRPLLPMGEPYLAEALEHGRHGH